MATSLFFCPGTVRCLQLLSAPFFFRNEKGGMYGMNHRYRKLSQNGTNAVHVPRHRREWYQNVNLSPSRLLFLCLSKHLYNITVLHKRKNTPSPPGRDPLLSPRRALAIAATEPAPHQHPHETQSDASPLAQAGNMRNHGHRISPNSVLLIIHLT